MTTIFEEEEGNVKTVPATILVIKRGGNMVTDKRWPEKHGHYSVQVGYERYQPDEQLGSSFLMFFEAQVEKKYGKSDDLNAFQEGEAGPEGSPTPAPGAQRVPALAQDQGLPYEARKSCGAALST